MLGFRLVSHEPEQQNSPVAHSSPSPWHPGSLPQTPPEQLRPSPQESSSCLLVVTHRWLSVSQVASWHGFVGSWQKGNFWEHVHCFCPFGPTHLRVRHCLPFLQVAPPGLLPATAS